MSIFGKPTVLLFQVPYPSTARETTARATTADSTATSESFLSEEGKGELTMFLLTSNDALHLNKR